ncbi:MAG: molybdopterin-dependent oxidoreductase, partial [Candidatus Jordarchaeaceae archaeon]
MDSQKCTVDKGKIETFIKGMGFSSDTGTGGNTVAVDVKDCRIIRIRPLHYDLKYKPEDFRPWQMEARGKVLKPGMKTLVPPHSLAYKKRVYSPNRVRFPLKRVDWDPNGERHPENRGKSGYVRISWDEALEIIAKEIKRIIEKYGPEAILCQNDGHGETKIVHLAHGGPSLLLSYLGGFTMQTRNADSWEGWYWGSKHVWGMDPLGLEPNANLLRDIAEHTQM